jgi:large subunit ribosomal protein L15
MTSKKRRQRGSRTHGGGTHKNRRGAGHRGGRGRAGRDKHEFHNYEPLGKHGFTRPEATQDTVVEVRVQELDEDAALLAAEGVAETEGEGGAYRLDARDVAEDGHDVDVVKVLGGGQVRNELHVTADAFTAGARGLIEAAGGSAELSERAEARAEAEAAAEDDETESSSDDEANEA